MAAEWNLAPHGLRNNAGEGPVSVRVRSSVCVCRQHGRHKAEGNRVCRVAVRCCDGVAVPCVFAGGQSHPINVLWSPHDSHHFIVGSPSDIHLHVAAQQYAADDVSPRSVSNTVVSYAAGRVRRRGTRIVNRVVPPSVLVAEDFSSEEKGSAQQVNCFDWCLDASTASQFLVGVGTSSGSTYLSECVAMVFCCLVNRKARSVC